MPIIHTSAEHVPNPDVGTMYYESTSNSVLMWDGFSWVQLNEKLLIAPWIWVQKGPIWIVKINSLDFWAANEEDLSEWIDLNGGLLQLQPEGHHLIHLDDEQTALFFELRWR